MGKIKVLIVDDHPIMRDSMRALLNTNEDMEVVGDAADGEEAIRKVAELAPDVVIMDISMPGLDGIEASRRITMSNHSVKILILTQYNNKEYVLTAIKAGAVGFIPKRALSSELVSAIRTVSKGETALHPSIAGALVDEYRTRIKSDPYDQLTAREREVLKLIAEGRTSPEIAEKLVISLKTVLGHRSKITGKLNIHNRTELIKYAMRKGIINMDL